MRAMQILKEPRVFQMLKITSEGALGQGLYDDTSKGQLKVAVEVFPGRRH